MEPYYYGHDSDQKLIKKPVPENLCDYVIEKVDPTLQPIANETYWRRYAKWFMSAVRTCYFVHRDRVYWALDLAPFPVLRFSQGKIEACELPRIEDEDENPQVDLVFYAWDDLMEFELDEWERCSQEEADLIDRCLTWTNDVHQELNEIIPLKSLLTPNDEDD